jgi:dienelactone hydrolase
MTPIGRRVSYQDGARLLEGYLASPLAAERCPGVVLAPAWLNVTESMCRRADRLAVLGYAALVLDIFGAGTRPGPPQHPRDVVSPFMIDRKAFRRRLSAGLEAMRNQAECDSDNVAAVGYCLGGCGVLELARSGEALRGVVSVHGDLSAPLPAQPGEIQARVLVLHGDADPVVPFDSLVVFREEMRRAGADWQVHLYSDAKHSFSGEGAVAGETPGAALHPRAEARSWSATLGFLEEVLKS